MTLINGIQTN